MSSTRLNTTLQPYPVDSAICDDHTYINTVDYNILFDFLKVRWYLFLDESDYCKKRLQKQRFNSYSRRA